MLQLKNISKEYVTGELHQTALDGVSISFRDNEFAAVLGPSGSGKTTLLNIIGGLDRYDSGELIINGISTSGYKDRDWDSYRNHTIGFVFQSYNLIPHQTVLANVELALTISGISRSERKRRAKEALEKVGLGDQTHKRPNQMSGGQMQRVAIARALVNDPDILLADEPTGALDSETSEQVMELLNEVAKDRLVIMVTHNPELADKYATRIVRLKDGRLTDDSDPFEPDSSQLSEPEHKNMGRSSMSRATSLSLSFNNLRTKKGRTILTSFAGSIGIIGIALILSLSNGVSNYITETQRNTMASYPISIESRTYDFSAYMEDTPFGGRNESTDEHGNDAVYIDTSSIESEKKFESSILVNNLTAFKKYLDDGSSEIHNYLGGNGVVYYYDTKSDVFTYDDNGVLVNADGSTLDEVPGDSRRRRYSGSFAYGGSEFHQIMPGKGGEAVSTAILDNYDVLYGRMPEAYDELVLVLDGNSELPAETVFKLGLLPTEEYRRLVSEIENGGEAKLKVDKLDFSAVTGKEFRLLAHAEMYVQNSKGIFEDVSGDEKKVEQLLENALTLKIVGVIQQNEKLENGMLRAGVGYTHMLTDYIIERTDSSEAVKAQLADKTVNILNGMRLDAKDDKTKAEDAKKYIAGLNISEKAELFSSLMTDMMSGGDISSIIGAFTGELPMGADMPEDPSQLGEADMADAMDGFLENPSEEILLKVYDRYISAGDYDEIIAELGVVSRDSPSSIDIYADSFEDKDKISECIEHYNSTVSAEDKITYTDYIGLLLSSVTTIINTISYVLIAFVAVSLVVSSIMIGIITYISVLERTKEIGILRALGASKRNISQVFNAETVIIGFFAGVIGIAIALLLLIPVNAVIHMIAQTDDVSASLPVMSGIMLVLLSTLLTLIGGFIPSKKAAKKDPVAALRTE